MTSPWREAEHDWSDTVSGVSWVLILSGYFIARGMFPVSLVLFCLGIMGLIWCDKRRETEPNHWAIFLVVAIVGAIIYMAHDNYAREREVQGYRAYRDMIGCKAADAWDAVGKGPKPPNSALRRCADPDGTDEQDYRVALKIQRG